MRKILAREGGCYRWFYAWPLLRKGVSLSEVINFVMNPIPPKCTMDLMQNNSRKLLIVRPQATLHAPIFLGAVSFFL